MSHCSATTEHPLPNMQVAVMTCACLQACRAAKLFAKHIKLGEQQKLLQHDVCHMAVGTPHRISQLAGLGDLSLQRASLIIIDAGLDIKSR